MEPPAGQWATLSPRLRERLDELLADRRLIQAVVLLRGEGGLEPRPGLYQAQDLLEARRRELDRLGLLRPEPLPPTVAQLIERAAALNGPAAVEAVWDGDTQGWFVCLLVIVRRPGGRFHEMPLTSIRRGGDIRLFNGTVPPWPEAIEATTQGEAVAAHLGVPFHFTSPDTPDDLAARWWDTQPDH